MKIRLTKQPDFFIFCFYFGDEKMLINIEVPDKNDATKMITLVRYVVDRREDPTAVLFGSFVPFTGPNGHGRMLEFALGHEIKKFAIVMPLKDNSKDTERNMFSLEQKLEIAKKGANDMGFDVDVFNVETTNPLGMFRAIASKIARPVLIVGPDRKSQFEKMFITFDKKNEYITDQTNKNFGRGEILCINNRGNEETSGTKVRNSLRHKNKDVFLKLTGYDESMYDFLINIIENDI